MTRRSSAAVLRQMHTLFTAGTCNEFSDRQLLERFVARRDAVAELAFTTLVERHGPMVLGVCRRILVNSHEAEDAFQATFLVLVRRAGSIRVDGSIGRWLYGVATRVAARARANARRRHARERSGVNRIEAESPDTAMNAADVADVQSILAEELGKLPARFQAPIVLCDLEGLSHEETALFLGCPVGTVKSRLSRGRVRLRRALIRRGLATPDLSKITPLFPAALPRGLARATHQGAQAWILGRLSTTQIVSASVSTLTEGVLWTMFLTKLKVTAAALLLIGAGSAVLVSQATAQRPSAPHGAVEKPGNTTAVARDAPFSEDVLDLEMLERAWVDAVNRRDAAVVSRIVADDFGGIDSTGGSFTKPSYLLDLRNEALPAEPLVHDDIKVRVLGDTAVVTSRIKIKSAPTWNGLTNIYVKRQSRWRCIASHSSLLENQRNKRIAELVKIDLALLEKSSLLENKSAQLKEIESCLQDLALGGRKPASSLLAGQAQMMAMVQQQMLRDETVSGAVERADHGIRIRPRFKCLVETLYVKAGQTVKKGTPLVDLSSSIDLAEAKSDYLTKEFQSKHDQRVLEMRRKLFATNAISEQVLTDAQSNEEKSKLAVQLARDKLKFLGLNDDAIALVGKEVGDQKSRLTLRAPVDGTVTEVDAKEGNLYDMMSVLMILNATSSGQPTRR